MTDLTFTHEYRYAESANGITLPTDLFYRGKTISVSAKVDTGASYCLFRYEHGIALNIPIE